MRVGLKIYYPNFKRGAAEAFTSGKTDALTLDRALLCADPKRTDSIGTIKKWEY